MPVALHAAMMYKVIGHLSLLSPYYCLNFDKYQKLCSDTVKSRFRGKGVTGAPKARCQVKYVIWIFLQLIFQANYYSIYALYNLG